MKKLLATLVTCTGLVCSAQSIAADIELKLAHTWPKGFPIFGTSVDDYATMVGEMSDGRIEIKVDSRNKHKSCLLYTSPSPRDATLSRMPSSA